VVYITTPAISSCFVAFFYSPFEFFNFCYTSLLLFCNPFIDYGAGLSSFILFQLKLINLLNL